MVVAGALLRGAVVSRRILMLSNLVVICFVQNTHDVPLSAVVREETLISLRYLAALSWNMIDLRLGRNDKRCVMNPR